ncbi:cytochrome P450 [Annulohypoxylon nitens]|nr:cytochrome P450 [Annulohypoxylon nitens]
MLIFSRQLGLLSQILSKHTQAFQYLLRGTSIIQSRYEKSNGQPFEVFAPDNRYVFVSSDEHIQEVNSAPDTVLSLQGASKQMLQPVYTMSRFNWFNVRGTEGVGFVRTLRTLLTNNLPNILPQLGALNAIQFATALEKQPVVNGSTHCKIYPVIVDMVVVSNAVSFFGADLVFLARAKDYIEETLICAEIVRLVPKFLSPIIGRIISRYLVSQDTIFDTLLPIAEQRCQERDHAKLGRPVPKHSDCIQWIMETSPRQKPWSPQRVVHELMAIWFGSVHALSTTIVFAVHDLCLHPEYIAPLRVELERGYSQFERTAQGLDLLDSFIKESARLTPVEASKLQQSCQTQFKRTSDCLLVSTRRSALQPFEFSDGTKLNVGDWACTPVRSIMQNAKNYPEPLSFNGFRFVDPSRVSQCMPEEAAPPGLFQPTPSKLTDVDNMWHVWGTGRMAWYVLTTHNDNARSVSL